MRGLVAAAVLVLAAGCGGGKPGATAGRPSAADQGARGGGTPEPPARSPVPAGTPQVFTGKVVPLSGPGGKPGRLALAADDGTTYPLVEDDASRMFFLDARLRGRPVVLTAVRVPDTGALEVVYVQTVKDGVVCEVDYWCEICQISSTHPGPCVCCGDDAPLRERPAR
jgi:hypothetical protein